MTIKQRLMRERFVAEYLIDMNGARAAVAAGYAEIGAKVQASRLLTDANVREQIAQAQARKVKDAERRAANAEFTKDRWLAEVAGIAHADITDAFATGPDGKMTMTLAELKKSGFGKLISSLKVMPNGKVEFRLHPKIPALELMARHFGWVKDQVEHSGVIGTAGMDGESLRETLADPRSAALVRELAMHQLAIQRSKKSLTAPVDAPAPPNVPQGGESDVQV